ncbi:SGNH/GDSL hydrolase family protein [Selenomonas dianae]|uniref:SGNH/GDSL hydrolase family protein n=1 Tax=Selenomonas dianae TaxID=135079 RepID=A0ABN0T5S3_9FIRM|nr:SGNH/GDSL hydrolase family protein [Selenomonas dianae]WLD82562.1 SGNH/GDSL hydrolase family protein [Selenomonas dianae]
MAWKKYCTMLLGGFFAGLVVYAAAAEWMVHRLNETYVGDVAAIELQLHENALYGSALTNDTGFLKYGIISRTQPEIIALGTSRVMQFRAPFFKDATFYTTGGLGRSVDVMEEIFDRISSTYVPKIVIFAVDWFWFNPNHSPAKVPSIFEEDHPLSNRAYLYGSLYRGLLKNENVRAQLVHPEIVARDLIGNRPTIGLMAGAKSDGFRLDGSFQIGEHILHHKSTVERFADTHRTIREGGDMFEWADQVDERELLKLASLIAKMRERGAHVIVLLPPFPNEIYQALMESKGHRDFILQFEGSVRDLCAEQNVPFYDFSNMAWLGASDEEAYDGFHASERTYGRIVLQFESDPVIAPYINKDFIEQCMVNSDHPYQIIPADM